MENAFALPFQDTGGLLCFLVDQFLSAMSFPRRMILFVAVAPAYSLIWGEYEEKGP